MWDILWQDVNLKIQMVLKCLFWTINCSRRKYFQGCHNYMLISLPIRISFNWLLMCFMTPRITTFLSLIKPILSPVLSRLSVPKMQLAELIPWGELLEVMALTLIRLFLLFNFKLFQLLHFKVNISWYRWFYHFNASSGSIFTEKLQPSA